MHKNLVIDYSFSYRRTALLEDGELTELIIEENDTPQLNSIYLGTIKKILPNKFVFIDLGYEKNCFLSLEDKQEKYLYKYDEKQRKTLKIKEGQQILVQVKREGTDTKGVLVTSSISLTGKYLILILNSDVISISKKIKDESKRDRLKEILKRLVPKGYGAIARTSCESACEEKIKEELIELIEKSESILNKANQEKVPTKIFSADTEAQNIIRDLLRETDTVYINDKDECDKLKNSTNFKNINFYDNKEPIFENFYIENQIEKALHNKIWLKSGGFIVIDEVEAMTIIDINSGKNIAKNYDKMVFKTNLEAVYEIFKQIRLRNLSGMIIVDFIDMENEEETKMIYQTFNELIKRDRIPTFILSITEIGLLQLTRKKTRKSLREVIMCNCPACLGLGKVKNERYLAATIKNKVIAIFSSTVFNNVKVVSNRRIIDRFNQIFDKKDAEKTFSKNLQTKVIQTVKLDYFEIEKSKDKEQAND